MNKNSSKVVIVSVIVSAVIILLLHFSLLDIWQEKILDKFFISKKTSNEIVIFVVDNESISKVGRWPWSRSVFADAINKLQSARSIAIDINFSEPSETDPAGDSLLASAISNSKPKIILPIQIDEDVGEILRPLPIFREDSLEAVVNVISEDGIVRKAKNFEDGLIGFGAAVTAQYKDGLFTPEFMRIDYAGSAKTFLTLPIIDLLENKTPERIHENKIVIIGVTAPDLHDFFQTPTGLMSGVEIHANIINTIINQEFYQDLPAGLSWIIILGFNLLTAWFILKIRKFSWLLCYFIASLVGLNILVIILFSWKIIAPILYINLGFISTAIVLILLQYIFESKEKRFIHNSFKYYLAPDVINELISDPKKLKLGGERKRLTVLFSDIRGFTSMSEKMTPEQLTHILNEYLTEMTNVVLDNKGLVDKYIGDAVMAFWGAPLANTNQAIDACSSAIKMTVALKKLNEYWKSKESITEDLHIGIGINTGDAVVGNFGSKTRFNYTVLGDEVNLTSRLEGLNKIYGTEIIITEVTKKEIENNSEIKTRELDSIIVKGRKRAVTIFEIMAVQPEQNILNHFNKGRELYKEGKWAQAMEHFSLSAKLDNPSRIYLERCKDLLDNPPLSWDGVYEFKTK